MTDPAAPETGAKGADDARYTKTDLTAKIKREVSKVEAERDQLATRLAELEQKAREAEEAKLSATQRADLERKREREQLESRCADAEKRYQRERSLRHETLRDHAAARYVGRVADKLFNADIVDDLTGIVREAIVVEDDGEGAVRLALRLGSAADTEPLNDAAWQKYVDLRLTKYFKAEGGAGARHGGGATSHVDLGSMTAQERIAFGLKNLRRT